MPPGLDVRPAAQDQGREAPEWGGVLNTSVWVQRARGDGT